MATNRKRKTPVCRTCGHAVTGDRDVKTCLTCQLGGGNAEQVQGTVGWPILSDALAVHAKDVPAAIADAAKRGVPTEFKKDGRPVLRDRAHRRAYLKAYGFHDRNSFTGY